MSNAHPYAHHNYKAPLLPLEQRTARLSQLRQAIYAGNLAPIDRVLQSGGVDTEAVQRTRRTAASHQPSYDYDDYGEGDWKPEYNNATTKLDMRALMTQEVQVSRPQFKPNPLRAHQPPAGHDALTEPQEVPGRDQLRPQHWH